MFPGLRSLPFDHIAIAVADVTSAARPYQLLGFSVEQDETLPQQGVRVRMLASAGSRVELLEPIGPESSVARFLERRGPGLHHLALRVDSLEREMDRLTAEGARFTAEPRVGHGGSRVVFLHPEWTGGVLIELVEPSLQGSVGATETRGQGDAGG